ncbi:MAG: hypothetical protein H6624_14760 [Bdellovibrionaceae bacterium]|nr:hypothetical protein [Bdellovibrionales bacterium]MCB9085605.1 hypothetical protein [Pseudobdellovibrionaceae bacterium]
MANGDLSKGLGQVFKEELAKNWILIVGCFLIIAVASSCTELRVVGSEGSEDKETTLESRGTGNGNGTGYGGKPTYYWIDPNQDCVAKDGSQSNVKGIITVGNDKAITYYDGCKEENGEQIPSQEVVFSEHNPEVLYFRRKGSIFEERSTFPKQEEGKRQVVASCDFTPFPEVLSGTNSYFSRINVTVHRWNDLTPYYTMNVKYEQVDVNGMRQPIRVFQGSEMVIEVGRWFEDSGRTKEYQELSGPHRELKSTFDEFKEFEMGRFEWYILGRERTFYNGKCFHERPVPR